VAAIWDLRNYRYLANIWNNQSYQYIVICVTYMQRHEDPHLDITTTNQDLPLPINFIPQHPRTFKRYHFPWFQHQILTCLRVSSPQFVLIFNTKFAESDDKNILTILQGVFYDPQQLIY
jgi:hypothetical protein